MEKANLQSSSESLGKINSLIDNINQTCDMLVSALDLNSDAVGVYGISLTEKMDTEFVDIILLKVAQMKNHLIDLKREVNKEFSDNQKDVEKIISSLREVGDNLDILLLGNGFYRNNFEMPIREVQTMIERVYEEVYVK
ncbi:MAG: hypothetical protein WAZ12_00590 [Candidatus Absconditicoccaceae bacterium]